MKSFRIVDDKMLIAYINSYVTMCWMESWVKLCYEEVFCLEYFMQSNQFYTFDMQTIVRILYYSYCCEMIY